jgi:Putative lumazine-binding
MPRSAARAALSAALLAGLAGPVPAAAQSAQPAQSASPARPAAISADSAAKEARHAVDRLFEGMRKGDSAIVRSAFHPAARLFTAGGRDGEPGVTLDSIDEFVRAVGTPHTEVWDERISNVRVQVDGHLAAVWADYAFYAGDKFSHCGVDAFQLARDTSGWKIIAIADTRRRTGCPGQR